MFLPLPCYSFAFESLLHSRFQTLASSLFSPLNSSIQVPVPFMHLFTCMRLLARLTAHCFLLVTVMIAFQCSVELSTINHTLLSQLSLKVSRPSRVDSLCHQICAVKAGPIPLRHSKLAKPLSVYDICNSISFDGFFSVRYNSLRIHTCSGYRWSVLRSQHFALHTAETTRL